MNWLLVSLDQQHKFIGFLGLFQIHVKSIILWVHIIYTQMSCIICV
jgi:hypothetical protein